MEAIGPLQVRVMHYIWKAGSSTVHQVHDALNSEPGSKQLAYTTILTVMRNLARRRFLSQTAEGRAHRFAALIDETSFKIGMVQQLRKDLFAGDVRPLLTYMAQDPELTEDLRAKLAALGHA